MGYGRGRRLGARRAGRRRGAQKNRARVKPLGRPQSGGSHAILPRGSLASASSESLLFSAFRARSSHVVQLRPIGIQCLPHPISDRSTHASADGARPSVRELRFSAETCCRVFKRHGCPPSLEQRIMSLVFFVLICCDNSATSVRNQQHSPIEPEKKRSALESGQARR
jgi:hypothetical protein